MLSQVSKKSLEVMLDYLKRRGYKEFNIHIPKRIIEIVLILESINLFVYMIKNELGKQKFRNLVKNFENKKNLTIIVISSNLTSECKKDINIYNICNKNMNFIEIFKESELQYNVFDNVLVSPVTKIEDDELKRLKEYYGDFSKFPYIKKTDFVARAMGYKKGDVIGIDRPHPYYRFVV